MSRVLYQFSRCHYLLSPSLTSVIYIEHLYTPTEITEYTISKNIILYVTWNRLGRNYIDCVAKSLPTCTTYLQFKYNESMEGSPVDFQVSSLEYAGIFAENRCKMWPDGKGTNSLSFDVFWQNHSAILVSCSVKHFRCLCVHLSARWRFCFIIRML